MIMRIGLSEFMSAYEIMLSESQERMLLCVRKGHEEDVIKLFKEYDLEAVVIGRVTEGHQYVLRHHGKVVTDIPVSSLTEDVLEEPSEERVPQRILDAKKAPEYVPEVEDANEMLKKVLAQPTIASKEMFTQTYDSQVRTSTVVGPGSDSGVLRVRGTKKGLSMTTDGNGRFVYLDPKIGGKRAVAEACANIVSSGALPLGMTDCLNYGDPNVPEIYWELHQSVEGMAEACKVFDTPVISGNVSLYNENNGEAIYGTPMVGMVGLIKDIKHVIPSFGKINGALNDLDLEHMNLYMRNLLNAMEQGLVQSSHDASEGGLAVAMAETVFGTELGLKLDLDLTKAQLFSETPGRFIVTAAPENAAAFEKILGDDAVKVGVVTSKHEIKAELADGKLDVSADEAQKIWEEALPCLMKSKD